MYIQNDYLGWKLTPEQASSPSALIDAVKEHLEWRTGLYLALLGGTAVAVLGLLVLRIDARGRRAGSYLAPVALGVGLLALLTLPTAWALSNVLGRGNTMLPFADLSLLARNQDGNGAQRFRGLFGGPANNEKLIAFLRANHQGERFLLATSNTQQAAPILIATGEPVMALGGFMGSDLILTVEKFAQMVEERQVRFVLIGGFGFRRRPGGSDVKTIADWVRENGKTVDPALWRPPVPDPPPAFGPGQAPRRRGRGGPGDGVGAGPPGGFGGFRGWMGRGRAGQLYDLRPKEGIVSPPAE